MSVVPADAFPAFPPDRMFELHPPGDFVSDVIRETGDFYERAILDELARRITGGVLIDVGAMIGNHTVFLAAFVPHSEIHAFEPLPANLALLRRNAALLPTVTIHPCALSDHGHVVRLTAEPDNLGHARIADDGTVSVRAIPLDAYDFQDVTLLKIDVEGHEPEVLAGARQTIERCRPLIVIEDWKRQYAPLLPGYRVAAEWERAHQTFLYEPIPS